MTIYQLKMTRGAADAAKAEAERIHTSWNRLEKVNEAVRATTSLETARKFLISGLWLHASDSYELVMDSLESLKTDSTDLREDHVEGIDKASAYIRNLSLRIQKDTSAGNITVNSAKVLSVMSEHRILLKDITKTLEKEFVR